LLREVKIKINNWSRYYVEKLFKRKEKNKF